MLPIIGKARGAWREFVSFAREEEVEEGYKECRQGQRDEDEEPDLHAFVRLAKLKLGSIVLMIDERT
jgi:hypothetical protein